MKLAIHDTPCEIGFEYLLQFILILRELFSPSRFPLFCPLLYLTFHGIWLDCLNSFSLKTLESCFKLSYKKAKTRILIIYNCYNGGQAKIRDLLGKLLSKCNIYVATYLLYWAFVKRNRLDPIFLYCCYHSY